jgi:hypothetical protein
MVNHFRVAPRMGPHDIFICAPKLGLSIIGQAIDWPCWDSIKS